MRATSFFEQLAERVQATGSLLCVGLDPRSESVEGLREECARLIDATREYAAAYKPNSAFFEAHGPEGMLALLDVVAYIPDGIPVLLDAKRGDIASTSAAYAQAVFQTLGAGAVTVSPYVGGEGLRPFLERPEFAAFVLCKTSNPGADEFQALLVEVDGTRRPLFERVAEQAQRWSQHGNVGLVVGATDPAALARVRALAPGIWILVPGVGAQGGDLEATLAAGLRADGQGLLINVSRSIAEARDPRAEARRISGRIADLRSAIGEQRAASAGSGATIAAEDQRSSNHLPALAQALLASGCVRFGQFTLKSGQASPIYLDLRRLVSQPQVLAMVARAYAEKLHGLQFDRLAGIPYAALPIATAISLEMARPMIYPRREVKDYGTRAAIEGDFNPGEMAVVIDDLATTGGTKIESIEKLTAAGLSVRDIVVLIDREQGAGAMLAEAGYHLHAVATLRELLAEWQRTQAITADQYREVNAFLESGPQ